jgi:murein tripeptide amidase MpaA
MPRSPALLKKIRVVVVPLVNPDGFVHSREASPVYNPC